MNNEILFQDIESVCKINLPWHELKDKSVLITGATGFIGSFIVNLLMQRNIMFKENINVYALGRNEIVAKERFEQYWNENNFEFISHDLCEPLTLETQMEYIFHCASNASPEKYVIDPVGTMRTNLDGTINLLEFARTHGTQKIVYTSTIEVYGKTEQLEKIKEHDFGYLDSMTLRSNYPISKKAAEMLCTAYVSQYDLNISVGRIPYTYGPGMRAEDKKVVVEFIRNVSKNENIILKSAGLQKRSYCYVADIVSALFTILFYGEKMEAYNIASDHSIISIAGLAEKLVALFPEKNLEVRYEKPEDVEKKHFSFIQDAILDSDKLQKLGWVPMYNLDVGLKRSVMYEL